MHLLHNFKSIKATKMKLRGCIVRPKMFPYEIGKTRGCRHMARKFDQFDLEGQPNEPTIIMVLPSLNIVIYFILFKSC